MRLDGMSLAQLKRRLAAMRAQGMIGLDRSTTDLSPAARQLLALLSRSAPTRASTSPFDRVPAPRPRPMPPSPPPLPNPDPEPNPGDM